MAMEFMLALTDFISVHFTAARRRQKGDNQTESDFSEENTSKSSHNDRR